MSRARRPSPQRATTDRRSTAARSVAVDDRRFTVAGLAVVLAAIGVVYANSLGAELVLDARPLILDNPALRQLSLASLRTVLTSPYWHPFANDGLYRPATTLSYLVNYAVLGNGERPLGYHVVNLALHMVNAMLVFAIVARVGRRRPAALLAAAIFGVHPVTTEAVTNVVGRADLLATLGVLAGLLCYIQASSAAGPTTASSPRTSARRGHGAWLAGLVASALVAAFSKESGLTLLPLVVSYDAIVARVGWRAFRARWRLVAYGLLALVGATALVARSMVARAGPMLEDLSPIDNPIVEVGFWRGRLTGIKAVGHELALMVWPHRLSADYSFAQVPVVHLPPVGWDDWQVFVTLIALAALAGAAFRLRRGKPALSFCLLAGLVTLLPTANVVVVIGSIMAERFLYLPLFGFASAAALACDPLLSHPSSARRRLALALLGTALVACGWRTVLRNRDWRDDPTLAARTVETAPASAKAQRGYAVILFEQDARHERLDEVIEHTERAVAIRADYIAALLDLGSYYLVAADAARSRHEDPRDWDAKAADVLERARVIDRRDNRRFAEKMVATGRDADGIPETGHIELYERLAVAYWRLDRRADAVDALGDARRLRPSEPSRYVDLARALGEVGRWNEAASALFQALTINPDDHETARRLVELYRRFDPDGGELEVQGPDRVSINVAHPTVHRHRCDAYRDLARGFARANLRQAAARVTALLHGECEPE